jgi:parallel beta-helix repeat protein
LKRIASSLIVILLFLGLFAFIFTVQPAKAQGGIIYINPDGSISSPVPANITTSNNVTYTFTGNNYLTIVVNRNNTIINGMGYTLQAGSGNVGFFIEYPVHNVTIKNTIITNNGWGIVLDASNNDTLSGNTITENANYGIEIVYMGGNTVSGNNVTANGNGIFLGLSNNHTVSDNIVKANTQWGIELQSSSSNVVSDNNITANGYGIYFFDSASFQNTFYHNNLVGNTQQVRSLGSPNAWDNGYPSGGNYWSNYTGVDLYHGSNQNVAGGDGIGDANYTINANNTDRYPLMGPFMTFNAGTWNNTSYNVDTVSESNITNFNFNPYATPHPTLSFDVEGQNGTNGFCRVAIPRKMMWCDNPDEWVITVGGNLTSADSIVEDANYTYIYFTYTHSTKPVQIQSTHAVPEFQSQIILVLIVIATLLATAVYKRKRPKSFG